MNVPATTLTSAATPSVPSTPVAKATPAQPSLVRTQSGTVYCSFSAGCLSCRRKTIIVGEEKPKFCPVCTGQLHNVEMYYRSPFDPSDVVKTVSQLQNTVASLQENMRLLREVMEKLVNKK